MDINGNTGSVGTGGTTTGGTTTDGTTSGTINCGRPGCTPPEGMNPGMPHDGMKPHLHCIGGLYPPPKPRYTLQEDMLHTINEMRMTIDRMHKWECRMENEINDLMSRITSDNCLFKDTMTTSFNLFTQEIKAEVNLFEQNVDNTIKLFTDNLTADYENLVSENQAQHVQNLKDYEEKLKEFEAQIDEDYEEFKAQIITLINTNNDNLIDSSNAFQENLTEQFNDYKTMMNTRFTNFTETTNEQIATTIAEFESEVNHRLNVQDAKIESAETYMKFNIKSTVRNELSDMYDSGDFAEILEGEVFDNIQNKMDTLEADVTEAIEDCETRMDNIVANGNSTEGNSELIDIRVGADGVTYDSAGAAVRTQIGNLTNTLNGGIGENLFTVVKPSKYVVYRESSTPVEYDVTNSDNIVNMECYNSTPVAGTGTTSGFGIKLKKKIPFTSELDKKYTLYIKSDKNISGKIYCVLSSFSNWSPSVSKISFKAFNVNKGFNAITLEPSTYSYVDGADNLQYLLFPTDVLETANLEIYMCESDILNGLIAQSVENPHAIFEEPNTRSYTDYKNNLTATKTISETNFKATITERTTDAPEWRYYIGSYPIGTYEELKGKGVVVRNNSGASYFGISTNKTQWCKKSFKCAEGSSVAIDFDEFISSNATLSSHTDELFITFGKDLKEVTHNDEFVVDVDLLFVKSFDETLNPIVNFLTFNPEKFAEKKDNSIVCWGDSLTAQGGWTTELASLSGMTVYNGGTGGESVKTITARQGADVMTVNNIIIPATTTPVVIATRADDVGITTEFGNHVTPLLQGGTAHVNPVKIGDTLGTLTWTGTSYSDANGTWTFTRQTAGEEIVIDRPTAMTTAYDREKNNSKLMIIFMGQNGGYSSNEQLVNLHRRMIEHSNADNYLILGLATGSTETRGEYEEAMTNAFGRYFVSLRKYLVEYGLDDCGLTATDEDNTNKQNGIVSSQLFTDGVHFTDACKTAIGRYVYKKCCELNIL